MANLTLDEPVSPYKTIGGKGSKIARHPSELKLHNSIPERCSSSGSKSTSNGDSPMSSSELSRPGSVSAVASNCNDAILKWDEDEVVGWLHESGFTEYEVRLFGHG